MTLKNMKVVHNGEMNLQLKKKFDKMLNFTKLE
jgi:hypothetical protein